jgi:hypothetical protein
MVPAPFSWVRSGFPVFSAFVVDFCLFLVFSFSFFLFLVSVFFHNFVRELSYHMADVTDNVTAVGIFACLQKEVFVA